MTAADNKRIIREAFDLMVDADPTAFLAAMGDDCVWIVEGRSAWARRIDGKEAVQRELMGPLFSMFASPFRNFTDQIVAEDDTVVVRVRGEVTLKSGADYNNSYCFVIRMRDGKMVELREFADLAYAEAVLGPAPPA